MNNGQSGVDMTTVAVVGLGYVGLPLAVEFGKKWRTIGFDLSAAKVASYKKFVDPTGEVSTEDLRAATHLEVVTDPVALAQADFIVVAVPTPVDEAKWGFTTIEQTLWNAVPKFMRELDGMVHEHCGQRLPLTIAPVRFASWMGGDRDGNPNVTHNITQEVLWLSRWKAADLYVRDIEALRWELSIEQCSPELREALGQDHPEPYREYLRETRQRLKATRHWLAEKLRGADADDSQAIKSKDELLDDEFQKFLLDQPPETLSKHAAAIVALQYFFKAYATDSRLRDTIEQRRFTDLNVNPAFTMADFKAVPKEWRERLPEYIKDYVSLNLFN